MKIFIASIFSVTFATLLFSSIAAAETSEWDKVPYLDSNITVFEEMESDSETGAQSTYYHELMTGSINMSSVQAFSDSHSDTVPYAYPVSAIHANGTTERNGAIGSSYVHVNLMRDGATIANNSNSSIASQTVNTTASTYPGTVFPGTEYRALGTHRATVNTRTVQGNTGYILSF